MLKLSDVSPKTQLIVVVVLLVAVSGALYWFVYRAIDVQNRQVRAQVKAKQEENAALMPYEDKKADMERKITMLKDQLEQMKRIVPDEKEAPQFMEMVESEARKAGIEIRRYSARPTATREFFTEVPWDMELDGPYYSMLHFFENVARLDRIINVSGLKMATIKKPSEAGVKKTYTYAPGESVVVSCMTTTFFSRENEPAAPAPKAAAPKKK